MVVVVVCVVCIVISMIRYADDKASSEKNLQRLMDSVSRVTQEYGMSE